MQLELRLSDPRDEIRRLNRAVRTLSACSRALLTATDEQALIGEICRVAVKEGGYRLAWVSRAEQDAGKTVTPLAHAGFDQGYLETLGVTWADEERGRGPTGSAIRTGKPSIIRNVLTDPSVALWRDAAQERGYASVIALPLRVDGEMFGALTLAAPESDAFDPDEVGLLEEVAAGLAHGISELRIRRRAQEAEETLRHMAYYDGLTGLANRVLLCTRMEQAIAESRQRNRPFSLLRIEIDRFREISETLGSQEGQQLIKEVAGRLVQMHGESATVGRVHEDEFAVLLPGCSAEQGMRAAERILAALDKTVELSGLVFEIPASIGVSVFPGHGTDPEVLLRRAHIALYRARRSGGPVVYSGGMEEEQKRRLALMGDLRRAIENSEILLYCQPKVHMASRKLCGAEALTRWHHAQFGTVNPTEFIKIAEKTGLITSLTYWVLEAALRENYAWHQAGIDCPIAVNLCPHDLHDPKLVDRIKSAMSTWGAEPDWIQFELTESAFIDDPAGALTALARLKDLGVELLVDDFGTGYSSLSYLQKLPVDSIKMDQSFIVGMAADADSQAIVGSTIGLAHNLHLSVVAEGVESEEVWGRLADLGCDCAQGFAIGRPVPAGDFLEWEAHSRWH